MKTIFLAGVLALASLGAQARAAPQDCVTRSIIFETAANYRDLGLSPQKALDAIRQMNLPPLVAVKEMTEAQNKTNNDGMNKFLVNAVYFSPSNALPANLLSARILDACMNDQPKFEPLK